MSLGTDSTLNTIIHQDMHTSLTRAYPSIVTVQTATETKAADHSLVKTWANVSGMININGILAPATAREIRQAMMTNTAITHVLDLQTYYIGITNKHRVQVSRADGETAQTFNITGVKLDSQARSTRLELEEVSH